jgi:pimeloyl-ACP methyl ester carboxylesterase
MGILFYSLATLSMQDYFLYHPDRQKPTEVALDRLGLEFWPQGREEYLGLIGVTKANTSRGTILVFHGNAGRALDRAYYVEALSPLGWRVLLVEYPGYGGRPGKLGEETFISDARQTLHLVHERYGGPVLALGESLGSGVAASLARREPDLIDGVLLFTPWDTLAAIAQAHFSWLPLKLLLSDRYDSVANLQTYPGKIAVIGAGNDEIIPLAHARTLYEALPASRKKMWVVAGAGHNDWIFRLREEHWREYLDFVAPP